MLAFSLSLSLTLHGKRDRLPSPQSDCLSLEQDIQIWPCSYCPVPTLWRSWDHGASVTWMSQLWLLDLYPCMAVPYTKSLSRHTGAYIPENVTDTPWIQLQQATFPYFSSGRLSACWSHYAASSWRATPLHPSPPIAWCQEKYASFHIKAILLYLTASSCLPAWKKPSLKTCIPPASYTYLQCTHIVPDHDGGRRK
jgi:hypothetical protein